MTAAAAIAGHQDMIVTVTTRCGMMMNHTPAQTHMIDPVSLVEIKTKTSMRVDHPSTIAVRKTTTTMAIKKMTKMLTDHIVVTANTMIEKGNETEIRLVIVIGQIGTESGKTDTERKTGSVDASETPTMIRTRTTIVQDTSLVGTARTMTRRAPAMTTPMVPVDAQVIGQAKSQTHRLLQLPRRMMLIP